MNQDNNDNIIPISVAPMMDWTDRHCRYFHRLISPHAMLYTEMITSGALIHGDSPRFLRHDNAEHPLALQLGGSNPKDLSTCAKMGEHSGYNEINLNCGCPSDRVQKGKIGAILMTEPNLVAESFHAMQSAINIPVTIKCRIGIDEQDSFEFLDKFISTIHDAGCKTFIIHARKAWLKGLSPKENRTVPPIDYERAYAIKEKYPHLNIAINGDIKTVNNTQEHLKRFDSVMIGREAYQNPYILAELETEILNTQAIRTREEAALAMIPYIEKQMCDFDTPVKSITRHMTGLFQGIKGAKKWRQLLSTLPHEDGADAHVITESLKSINNG
ncbi:MAG: tRNA dihydrouridine(20/20a) synthase DusA [Alphaproteobacteria bacterium]